MSVNKAKPQTSTSTTQTSQPISLQDVEGVSIVGNGGPVYITDAGAIKGGLGLAGFAVDKAAGLGESAFGFGESALGFGGSALDFISSAFGKSTDLADTAASRSMKYADAAYGRAYDIADSSSRRSAEYIDAAYGRATGFAETALERAADLTLSLVERQAKTGAEAVEAIKGANAAGLSFAMSAGRSDVATIQGIGKGLVVLVGIVAAAYVMRGWGK